MTEGKQHAVKMCIIGVEHVFRVIQSVTYKNDYFKRWLSLWEWEDFIKYGI